MKLIVGLLVAVCAVQVYGAPQAPQAPQTQRPQRPSLLTSIRDQIEKRIQNRLEIRKERLENRRRGSTVSPPIISVVNSTQVAGTSNSSSVVVVAPQVAGTSTTFLTAADTPQVEGTSATSSAIVGSPIAAGTSTSNRITVPAELPPPSNIDEISELSLEAPDVADSTNV